MRKYTLFLLLAMLAALTGCDKECSYIDCIQEQFVFKLTDAQGVNLLDNGTVKLEQVYLQPKGSPNPVRFVTGNYASETLIIAAVSERETEYLLLVEGYDPQNLKIDFDVVTGDCCTSVTVEKVYQNGNPAPDTGNGSVGIRL